MSQREAERLSFDELLLLQIARCVNWSEALLWDRGSVSGLRAKGNRGKPDLPPIYGPGSRKARKGQLEHATYSMSFKSYIGNTGDLMQDAKEGGK